MHTAWKARCKVKEAFPAIYNSLNNEIELLVATEIVHCTVWGGGGAAILYGIHQLHQQCSGDQKHLEMSLYNAVFLPVWWEILCNHS